MRSLKDKVKEDPEAEATKVLDSDFQVLIKEHMGVHSLEIEKVEKVEDDAEDEEEELAVEQMMRDCDMCKMGGGGMGGGMGGAGEHDEL